jgi:tetratricopeptide (TPR) repeat protein
VPTIRQEVQRALELADYNPRTHGISGVVAACCDYDWPKANQHFEQAISGRGATDAEVRWSYAKFYLMPRGRHAEAIDLMRLCVREDPLNIAFLGAYLDCLNTGGLYEDALTLIKRIDEIYPAYWIRHLYEAETRIFTGDLERARASAEEARRQAPWHSRANGLLAAVLALQGDAAGARDLTDRLQAKPDWAPAGMVVYSLLVGDLRAAAHWYQEAVQLREMWVIHQSHGRITRDLRASEHWPALAAMMRLPANW